MDDNDRLPVGKQSGPKVYFLGAPNHWFVKIGYTTDGLTKRRRKVENDLKLANTGGSLCVLACLQAAYADEQALHRHFKSLLMTDVCSNATEYFYPKPRLVDYIRWLRNHWFVATSEDAYFLGCATSDQWFPCPGRTIPAPTQRSLFDEAEPWACLPVPEITGDDYYTSRKILTAVHAVLGRIDLDPASHPVANREVRAERIYTNADNGLTLPWAGRVWLNPPFSAWDTWAAKLDTEWRSGTISEMCVLACTRTITAKQFHPVVSQAAALCVFHGRIPFWGPHAGATNDGHCVFYFGSHVEKFERVFLELGTVYVTSHRKSAAKPGHQHGLLPVNGCL